MAAGSMVSAAKSNFLAAMAARYLEPCYLFLKMVVFLHYLTADKFTNTVLFTHGLAGTH